MNLVPIHTLLIYASEGDNALPAEYLAGTIYDLLELRTLDPHPHPHQDPSESGSGKESERERRWKKPRSWGRGLMGPELSRERGGEMFG